MRLALAIGSFVILIVHGIVFYNQFFHKWEDYQTAYFDQAKSLAQTEIEKAGLEARRPRIEQAVVTQFGDTRVDRCQTCHIAVDDPRFKDHAHPLRAHPYSAALGDRFLNGKWERAHKFSDFGCTVCHDGQGRGLEQQFSHGTDEYWPEPMLGYVTQATWRKEFRPRLTGAEYMQANCAQCHTDESFAGTALVTKGRKLFFSMNCYGCHKIEGLAEGTLAPELTEAGKKFKIDYLWESIVDPTANLATSFMPNFHLKDEDVKALVVFLKSRRGVNFAETSLDRYRLALYSQRPVEEPGKEPELTGAALINRGKELVEQHSCTSCHKLQGKDGHIAPDLSYEGLERDGDWVYEHFRSPRSRTPDSIMPAFRFRNAEFRAMTAYVESLGTRPAPTTPAETFKTLCERCHGEKGDGKGLIAWYLDPYPRDLSKAGFMNSKPLDRFVHSIQHGVPGTSMPAWGKVLSDEQVHGVLEYVLTNITKQPRGELKLSKVPESNPMPSSAESIARGEKTFVQRCSGCHGRKADGKGPNSLDIVPRPRNLRNSAFVISLDDQRLFRSILYGIQGTAMPAWIDYGFTPNTVGDLVNFIRSLNAKSPAGPLAANRPSDEGKAHGR